MSSLNFQMYRLVVRNLCAVIVILSLGATQSFATESALELKEIYMQKVDRKLDVPQEEQLFYADQLIHELHQAGLDKLPPQYVVLVDRNPKVQAILLFWISNAGIAEFIGASPVSTGRRGGFMYYETPTGVFDHSVANPDFRAEGTENTLGILGYGIKGMRVYDFGWVRTRRMWKPGEGRMRLQMHSTDPRYLEPRLGISQSMGCIRIPATLNALIDHYGILDADYERARASSRYYLDTESRSRTHAVVWKISGNHRLQSPHPAGVVAQTRHENTLARSQTGRHTNA